MSGNVESESELYTPSTLLDSHDREPRLYINAADSVIEYAYRKKTNMVANRLYRYIDSLEVQQLIVAMERQQTKEYIFKLALNCAIYCHCVDVIPIIAKIDGVGDKIEYIERKRIQYYTAANIDTCR